MDDALNSGQQYALVLLAKWVEIGELADIFRTNLLTGEADHKVTFTYVARLTRFWGELYPKIKDRTDLKDMVTDFEKYQVYYFDPEQLADPGKSEEIFKLESVLRDALEKLKILRWEGD